MIMSDLDDAARKSYELYAQRTAEESGLEIGEPVTNFDEASGNMHFTIPITMRGMMAANYLKWRKENGHD